MSELRLEDALSKAGNRTDFVRTMAPEADSRHLRLFRGLPDEFTNWREEQQAWKESAGLADLSHHMYDLRVEGPEALRLFSDLGVNNFDTTEPGKAKQFVPCNPDGDLIGDGILFHLDDNEFNLVGYSAINWVQYHLETGDYDVTAERDDHSGVREGPPKTFRYQVQGPAALQIIKDASGGEIPDVPFFNFGDITIDGHEVQALRHGMMDEPGFEIFGDWTHAEGVRDAIVSVGRDYGLRQIGGMAYPTNVIPVAWFALPVPAIFHDGMEDYRRWLDAGSFEGAFTVGGSYDPDDVTDYYVDPVEAGYGRFIDFDHDFIGKDAVREKVANQRREKVTLVWDGEDVSDVFGSLFRSTATEKFIKLPTPNWAVSMYDAVRKDGEQVGASVAPRYLYFEKSMFSLAIIDTAHSDPGTEVTLTWGEGRDTPNPRVESHVQTEIRATVHPAPYYEDKKKTTDYTAV